MTHSAIRPVVRKRAKQLRKDMTPPERELWAHLKALKVQGMHFRRQTPVGPYVADFAWLSRRVIVELDGSSHDGVVAQARDAQRQRFLEGRGFKVLRFSNRDVLRDVEVVVATVIREVEASG